MTSGPSGPQAGESIYLRGEFITLGQLMKVAGLIDSGGSARSFLEANWICVNGDREQRRGRKLRPGDVVTAPDMPAIRLLARQTGTLK